MPLFSIGRFQPSLVPTLGLAAMLPVLLSLGSWQARRYAESTAKVAAYAHQHDELAPLESLDVGDNRSQKLHFRRAALAGKLLVAEAQLLTARYKFGKRGFSVVAPFAVAAGPFAKVLVLVGWVPEEHVDEYLASLAADPPRLVRGRVQFVNGLDPAEQPTGEKHGRPTWMFPNPGAMAKRIGGLDPEVLIESGEQATGNIVDPGRWPIASYEYPVHPLPSKHVEYSLTWFGAAAALIAVWMALSWRKPATAQAGSSKPANRA